MHLVVEVVPGTGDDLGLVDGILRLHVLARRLGWSVELVGVGPRLGELLELVDYASIRGGSPNSANSSG